MYPHINYAFNLRKSTRLELLTEKNVKKVEMKNEYMQMLWLGGKIYYFN